MTPKSPPPAITEPDLVDRIFDYLLAEFPQIAGLKLEESKRAVREEFRGSEAYIPGRSTTERQRLATEVLALFNGRNATEVARRLDISRATVYRRLKQAGSSKSSLKFPVNETNNPVRSIPSKRPSRSKTE